MSEVKDLGVTLDSKLSFNSHVEIAVGKPMKLLGFIFRITQNFKDVKSYRMLYFSLVRSRIGYASSAWNPFYHK